MAEVEEPAPPEAPSPPRRRPDDSTDHPLPSMRKALERALPAGHRASSSPSLPPQPVIPVIPPSPRSASPSSPPSTEAPSPPPSSSDRPPKHLLDRSRPRSNSDASSSSVLPLPSSRDPSAVEDLSSSNLEELDENDNENEHPRTRSRLNSPASWSSSSGSSTGVASSLDSGLSSDATSPGPADKSSAREPSPQPTTARTAPKRKSIPVQRIQRGPTAREKKELARQRRMDRRRAPRGLDAPQPVGSDRVLRSRAHADSAAPDAGLSKVRELYI